MKHLLAGWLPTQRNCSPPFRSTSSIESDSVVSSDVVCKKRELTSLNSNLLFRVSNQASWGFGVLGFWGFGGNFFVIFLEILYLKFFYLFFCLEFFFRNFFSEISELFPVVLIPAAI